MRLLIRHHLQTMLDAAQEIVRCRQFVAGRVVDPAAGGERAERRDGWRPRRPGMPSTGNELLGLDEKLDLADAAAAELDIVPLDRDFAVSPIGVNLPASSHARRRRRRNRDISAR